MKPSMKITIELSNGEVFTSGYTQLSDDLMLRMRDFKQAYAKAVEQYLSKNEPGIKNSQDVFQEWLGYK